MSGPNDTISDEVDALLGALNDRGASVGDVLPAVQAASGGVLSPGNFGRDAPLYMVVCDGRNRLWRFSYADGGSYKLIFDPGI